MMLKRLAQRVVESYGLLHQTNIRVLRHYIKTTLEDELTKEISEIDSARQLRILWEAGLNTRLQEVVLERLKKMS